MQDLLYLPILFIFLFIELNFWNEFCTLYFMHQLLYLLVLFVSFSF
jgi:hypothetical protein